MRGLALLYSETRPASAGTNCLLTENSLTRGSNIFCSKLFFAKLTTSSVSRNLYPSAMGVLFCFPLVAVLRAGSHVCEEGLAHASSVAGNGPDERARGSDIDGVELRKRQGLARLKLVLLTLATQRIIASLFRRRLCSSSQGCIYIPGDKCNKSGPNDQKGA